MSFIRCTGVTLNAECPRASDVSNVKSSKQTAESYMIGRFHTTFSLSAKQKSILASISPAMDDSFLRETIIPLTTQKSEISLRALDWLVTNYSKKHNITLLYQGKIVNVFQEYKNALSHYRRRNFDPFRRRVRIFFDIDGETHETTVGQLNFILWAENKGICKYTFENIEQIERDMNETTKQSKMEKEQAAMGGKKRTRKELSQPDKRPCSVHDVNTTVFADA